MSLPTTTKAHVLRNKPTGNIVLDGPNATFKLEEKDVPELKDGQLLLELLYLSNDPAQRGWMDANQDPERLYVPPINSGDVMRAGGIYKVLASKNDSIPSGKIVRGYGGWAQYQVGDAQRNALHICEDIPGISVTQYLGALGGTGLTAYTGLINVGEATKDDVIVVSGAAGATGSMVVQIAKHIIGCKKIIGLAGSDEKCRWVESLGADLCINYKKDWKTELKKATTKPLANVYFDNVGGETLDFMLTRLGMHGRVVACGAISDYNSEEKYAIKNWFDVVTMRLNIKGFIVIDFTKDFGRIVGELVKAVKEWKIKAGEDNETVVDTKFEDIPKTWTKLFEGGNRGKLVTKLV
jgi:NADPH-dependent curcumin reductase CurA